MKLSLPFVRQENDYFCGPASLAMVMAHFGIKRTQSYWARLLVTLPRFGTRRDALVRVARQQGFRVRTKTDATLKDIESLLRRGIPVLVNYRETDDDISHFAVVSGLERGKILLNDPWHGKDTALSTSEFVRRWYGKHRHTHVRWLCVIMKD